MNKLELKHLAPYLPYGLKGVSYYNGKPLIREVTVNNVLAYVNGEITAKIALRPLSDLVKPCLPEGKIPIVELLKLSNESWFKGHPDGKYSEVNCEQNGWHIKAYVRYHATIDIDLHAGFVWDWPYWVIEWLFEHHFDVNNLIGQNLATDINTIENETKKILQRHGF